METSVRVLMVGGISVLSYGLLLGFAMVRARTKAAAAPRYLFAAHLASIIQGTMLLALTNAAALSDISRGLETVAASILVAGVALFDLGLTANWLMRVGDPFKDKPIGYQLSAVGTPLVVAGVGILLVGVVRAA